MKKNLIGLTLGAFMIVMQWQSASATLITFDDVSSGTNINTQYAGVTLGCFNGTVSTDNMCTGNAYAVASPTAESSPNVISLTSSLSGVLTDERYGFFKAHFSTLQNSVSIDAKPVNPAEAAGSTGNRPFLQAFDSSNHNLGIVYYTGNTDPEAWETLTFNGSNNIAYVAFSSSALSGAVVYGEFDNLKFCTANDTSCATGGGNNGGGTSVPEPSSLLLLGLGIVGLGFFGRNRFNTI